jgi:hypothetical protein
MQFNPEGLGALMREHEWVLAIGRVLDMFRISEDWPGGWATLGLALRGHAGEQEPLPATVLKGLLDQLGAPERAFTELDLALAAYTVAWRMEEQPDGRVVQARRELRELLGYWYEDRCWRCHSYISDAPFDSKGRCRDCGWYACRACEGCGCSWYQMWHMELGTPPRVTPRRRP